MSLSGLAVAHFLFMGFEIEKGEAILEPILFDMGFELVDIAWFHQIGRWVLQLKIDSPQGVTLNDCEKVSREISIHLDHADFIRVPYTLEVSSPGLDRPLRNVRDYERFAGSVVRVESLRPVRGRSHWKGTLKGVREGLIEVEVDRQVHTIPIDAVKKAALVP